jgi:hypothetical protein
MLGRKGMGAIGFNQLPNIGGLFFVLLKAWTPLKSLINNLVISS